MEFRRQLIEVRKQDVKDSKLNERLTSNATLDSGSVRDLQLNKLSNAASEGEETKGTLFRSDGGNVRGPLPLKSLRVKPGTFEQFNRVLFELQLEKSSRLSADEALAELLHTSHLQRDRLLRCSTGTTLGGSILSAGKPRPGRPRKISLSVLQSTQMKARFTHLKGSNRSRSSLTLSRSFFGFFELQLEKNTRLSADAALAGLLVRGGARGDSRKTQTESEAKPH